MTFASIFAYLKKNFLVAASCFVVLVCLGVFFVRNDQITRLAADHDDLSVRHSRILKNLKFASEIEKDLKRLKAMDADVATRLFYPEDLATNQSYFYQAESASGVVMSSIQQTIKPLPDGRKDKVARKKAMQSKYQEIVYDMSVRGSYSEILAFVREIEGGSAFAALEGFSVMSSKLNKVLPVLDVRISYSVLGNKI